MTTVYNGSSQCEKCGGMIDPVVAMYNENVCTTCKAKERKRILKGKMVK